MSSALSATVDEKFMVVDAESAVGICSIAGIAW